MKLHEYELKLLREYKKTSIFQKIMTKKKYECFKKPMHIKSLDLGRNVEDFQGVLNV